MIDTKKGIAMRTVWQIESDIRNIKNALKRVKISDLKDGDLVYFRRDGSADSTPIEIAVDRRGPYLAQTERVDVTNYLVPTGELWKVGPKHLALLRVLIDELGKAWEAQEDRERANKSLHQRYVVWNYVYDFGGVEDRDGFLIEIFDGRGKLLLRNVWVKAECDGMHSDINTFCGPGEEVEITLVRFMAHLACEGERIKPVIVFCSEID